MEWRRGPVKRVVSGSFWVVSDGFCWLWVISDGFRWFAVLVVTRIHNIQKSYIFTILKNAYDWLRSFDFFIQSKTARKDYCRLKISDYFLCCIVLYFRSKTFFKRKQSQKKASGVLRIIWNKEFWRRESENYSKAGRLFTLTERREEFN